MSAVMSSFDSYSLCYGENTEICQWPSSENGYDIHTF